MSIERIDPEMCNGCGICVNCCPVDVIRMDKKATKPSSNILRIVCYTDGA